MKKGVQKIYMEVAPRYEFINHLLTFGLDIIWRKKAIRTAARQNGRLWLDVCTGTGEMAQGLAARARNGSCGFAVDFSLPMVEIGRGKKGLSTVHFALADVGALPFPAGTFDLVMIGFATRNINPGPEGMAAYFQEFHRVLKPGGMFLNLETSQPQNRLLRRYFHFYVKNAVRTAGGIFSGSRAGYKYLAHTIPRFYPADELSELLRRSGFRSVSHHTFFFGIAAVHTAFK